MWDFGLIIIITKVLIYKYNSGMCITHAQDDGIK